MVCCWCQAKLAVQLMGGRFRALLPSDLFRAGACARESLPAAKGADYANVANKAELKRLMRRCAAHNSVG